MFAVFESGNKQYHVKSGDVVKVEKLNAAVGAEYSFDKVLMLNGKVGAPLVKGASVKAEVIEQCKSDKVLIFKKKRRHNYRRKRGHRQQITVLRITKINE